MMNQNCSRTLIVLLTSAMLATASVQAQTTWYVDDDAPSDPGPGDPTVSDPLEDGSAEHPFDAIQEGIDAAADGDTVLVAGGVYTGAGNQNLDFSGKAIALRSESGAETCVIDCEGEGRGFDFHNGEGPDSVVDGFTITGGDTVPGTGGGIACDESSPTVTNCVIRGNTADGGGGVYCRGSSPTLTNCVVAENNGRYVGGGICCEGRSCPLILNCRIADNVAQWYAGVYGENRSDPMLVGCAITRNAAVYMGGGIAFDGSPIIIDCEISSNSAMYEGGGITLAGEAIIVDCTIVGNSSDMLGGGVSVWQGMPLFSDCVISGNRADFEGAGLTLWETSSIIVDCLIDGNRTGSDGGAVCAAGGSVTIRNCAITRNLGGGVVCGGGDVTMDNCVIAGNVIEHFGWGAAVYSDDCTLALTNCTLTGNSAEHQGGVYCCSDSNATLANCILWENSPGQLYSSYDSDIEVTCSDVQGGWTGDGNIDVDPGFAFADDPRLMPGSPCIDVGTNDPPGGLPPSDLDGQSRPYDGDEDGEAVADMGAYEFNPDRAAIACSSPALEFAAYTGGPNPVEATLSIRNAGGGRMWWHISETYPWLEVTPSAGSSSGEIVDVSVCVDMTGLSYGTHTYTLEIDSTNAVNRPRILPVTLHVGSGYPTIQMRIDEAVEGDTVLIPAGVYAGPGNKDVDFGGKAVTLRSVGGPETCIIDCEHSGRGFVFQNGEGPDAVVDGFTIMNGRADYGAGVYCSDSGPTISNCTITRNASGFGSGGGIGCSGEHGPTITNCTISANNADEGAGVSFGGPNVARMIDCAIVDNWADDGAGGIRCGANSRPTIRNCTVTRNQADDGGAITCGNNSSPIIDGCTIANNFAGWNGGGIYSVAARPTIVNCAISANEARSGGGVSCTGSSSAIIANSTITENVASDGNGGGIRCVTSNAVISNGTITRNVSDAYGGGVYFGGDADPRLTNCIIWDNEAFSGGNEVSVGTPDRTARATLSFSDIRGDEEAVYVSEGSFLTWGPGNIDTDPLFVDADIGDYHVSAGSPCIDAACNCGVSADVADLDGDGDTDEYVPFDLDGEGRFFDDPDTPDTGSGLPPIVDMGAYEFGGSDLPPCRGDLDGDRDVDAADLAVLLTNYGMLEGAAGIDGDMDCDGDVGLDDLAALLAAYGATCP